MWPMDLDNSVVKNKRGEARVDGGGQMGGVGVKGTPAIISTFKLKKIH